MRFPEFEFRADQFPAHFQMFGGVGGCGGSSSQEEAGCRRQTPRSFPRFSQSSCPVGQAAAFIPIFLGPQAARNAPRSRPSPTAGRSTPQAPPRWTWDHVPDTVLEDTISRTRDVLGHIFGFEYDPSPGTDRSCPARGAEPSSMPRNCSRKTASSTARCSSSPATEGTSSRGASQETRTAAHPSREDQRRERSAVSPCQASVKKETTTLRQSEAEKREDCERNGVKAVSHDALHDNKNEPLSSMKWTQSVSVSGFCPSEVEIKRKDNKVHVHAVREKSDGSGTCVSRVEMRQVVSLPEDVVQQSLNCTMTPDGTLKLQADRKTDLSLEKTLGVAEEKAERIEALEDKSLKLEAIKHEPEKLQTLATKITEDEDVKEKCTASVTPPSSTDGIPAEKAETTSTETACIYDEGTEDELHVQSQEIDANQEQNNSPIIQEPEDESFSEHGEENNSVKYSSEDFVIIDEDVNTENQNEAEDTDPTRPIRTVEDEQTADSNSSLAEETLSEYPEADQPFRVSLPLEGYSPRDVHVQLQGHTLSIRAHRQAALEEAAYTETVDRRVDLPDHLDLATVRCLYNDDGRLVISAQRLNSQRQVPVELPIM